MLPLEVVVRCAYSAFLTLGLNRISMAQWRSTTPFVIQMLQLILLSRPIS